MSKRCEVPFFNYPALFKAGESEYMEVLRDVLSRGAYILQRDMEEFEDNLENFLGVKHVLGVADGTNALILALLAAGIGNEDEVIMPSHTYVASAASVHYAGATPVLVECQHDHMIDPVAVRQAVTAKTHAIMPVQLNGRTASMDAICAIAEEYDLVIIEDAAQALGSRFKGRAAGSFGIAGTFSFYPAKLLGCFGDGGAVITNDDEMAKKISLLRDHGRDKNGEVVTWGTNCRLDNVQAAILNLKLKTYEQDIVRRREIAAQYQEGLGEVEHLVLPPAPDSDSDHFDVYQNYEIEADRRDELQCYLKEHGIGTIVQFGGKAVHQYPLGFEDVSLPYTEHLYKRALLLPMHTALSNDDIDYVCDSVIEFYS
jgi:Predicted pyridoxal phosphate-dependent enzyme apparently involved in regulation of cell wall biogenesis